MPPFQPAVCSLLLDIDVFGTVDEFVGNDLNVAAVSAVVRLSSQLKAGANILELEGQLLVN